MIPHTLGGHFRGLNWPHCHDFGQLEEAKEATQAQAEHASYTKEWLRIEPVTVVLCE